MSLFGLCSQSDQLSLTLVAKTEKVVNYNKSLEAGDHEERSLSDTNTFIGALWIGSKYTKDY